MRMKSTISNPRTLIKVLQSIEKISKSCVFKLTPTKLQFIVKDAADAGAQVWCMLPAAAAFDLDAYIIESAHRNEIFLEVPLTHLSRAFKSMAHAHAATIKLTRVPIAGPPAPPLPQPPASGTAPPPPAAAAAMMPVLAITISSESKSGRPLSIVHHVPVIPMRRAATAGLREPRIPASDVFIALPKPLGALKTVVERYSRMAAHVTISANHQGVLAISADGQVGQVETQFEGLVNPTLESNSKADLASSAEGSMTATNRDPSEFFSVDIFVKDLLKFLNCHQANPAHVICCIHRDLCVVFYVYLHGGMDPNTGTEDSVLTYFLPARHSS